MHDIIHTHIQMQQATRRTGVQFSQNSGSNDLSSYEIWDAIGARPTFMDRIKTLISFVKAPRQSRIRNHVNESRTASQATECLPQS